MTKDIPYPECPADDGGETPAQTAQQPETAIYDDDPAPPKYAAEETDPAPEKLAGKAGGESTPAQELQNKLDLSAAEAKALKDDIATIAKAEKDAADAIAKYPEAKEKLYGTQKPLECFRNQDWQRILKNPRSQPAAVKAIIAAVCEEIKTQAAQVEKLGEELATLNETAAQAAAKKVLAAAAFQKAVGYAAEVEGILRAGNDLASRATKTMTTQPAASFLLGYGAINYADGVKHLKTPAQFARDVTASLAALCTAAEAARKASLEAEGKTILWNFESKKLDALKANRNATITSRVAALDTAAPPASAPKPEALAA